MYVGQVLVAAQKIGIRKVASSLSLLFFFPFFPLVTDINMKPLIAFFFFVSFLFSFSPSFPPPPTGDRQADDTISMARGMEREPVDRPPLPSILLSSSPFFPPLAQTRAKWQSRGLKKIGFVPPDFVLLVPLFFFFLQPHKTNRTFGVRGK